ncbi:hypothetical protein [Burkholderia pseudomallei]|uniref:hypothetical protein n=1 Tax=Burkholderia pseudomallei TaxID=28450 RepID=UPI001061DD0D
MRRAWRASHGGPHRRGTRVRPRAARYRAPPATSVSPPPPRRPTSPIFPTASGPPVDGLAADSRSRRSCGSHEPRAPARRPPPRPARPAAQPRRTGPAC